MATKSFDLTIDERNTLLDVLWHCMEANVCCNVTTDGEWTDAERKAEWEKMQALCDKLEPKRVEKCGWLLKHKMDDQVWGDIPHEDQDKFQFITWEEQE